MNDGVRRPDDLTQLAVEIGRLSGVLYVPVVAQIMALIREGPTLNKAGQSRVIVGKPRSVKSKRRR